MIRARRTPGERARAGAQCPSGFAATMQNSQWFVKLVAGRTVTGIFRRDRRRRFRSGGLDDTFDSAVLANARSCRGLDLPAGAACRGSRRRADVFRRAAWRASARRRRGAGPGGAVYYTAQMTGKLGILEPKIRQGRGDLAGSEFGAAWRDRRTRRCGVDHRWRTECDRARRPQIHAVRVWPLGKDVEYANLNTLTFDAKGRVWFTGQSGYYGRLVPDDQRHEGVEGAARTADRTASRRRHRAMCTTLRWPATISRASIPRPARRP